MNAFSFDRQAQASLWRATVVVALGWLPFSPATSLASNQSIVGFYNVPVPAGNSAWVSGLVGPDVYEGTAATVSADTDGLALVTFTLPGWSGGDFPVLYYAEPQSGPTAGLALDILSNTTDTLKLNTTPAAAGLVSGVTFIVRKHATLAGLMPDGGGFQPFTDSISLFGTDGTQSTYFWNGTSAWVTALLTDASNVVIRPGQGFVIQLGAPLSVTLGKGEVAYVKTTVTQITATANVPNLTGALNPLSSTTTLGALGIVSSLESFQDSVVTLNAGTLAQTGTFLSNGSDFIDGLGTNSDGFLLPTGASVVVNVDATKNVTLAPVSVGP